MNIPWKANVVVVMHLQICFSFSHAQYLTMWKAVISVDLAERQFFDCLHEGQVTPKESATSSLSHEEEAVLFCCTLTEGCSGGSGDTCSHRCRASPEIAL